MTARDDFVQRLGGALMDQENPAALTEALDLYDTARRAEVLAEEAAELKAHCLEHNRFAATGFADCPCRVADELLRRVGVAGRGE